MPDLGKLTRYASAAKRVGGKPYFQQLTDLLGLATGRQRLGASEYYELGVFDDGAYSPQQKSDCVGWRASSHIDKQLNNDFWRAMANDKVMNYALLQHYGFAIPQTIATYSPQGRCVAGEQSLRTRPALEDFLLNALQFPVFMKPIHGSYGRGTYWLDSFEPALGCFVDSHGKKVAVDELVRACLRPQFTGMLFQKCLRAHDEVRALVGTTTSCVRVIVALPPEGPRVHTTFWKIARAHNITDNFCMGETGNLLAALNKASGTIERVVTGLWPDGQEVSRHPDTGSTLVGATLPHWQEAMDMCLAAALHFPGLRLQHWDVALCTEGPVLMELNTEADLGVPQFLGRTPFIDPVISRMLKAA